MPVIHPKRLERLQQITDQYTDTAGATEEELRLYVWFHRCLYSEILDAGGQERGYTFRQKEEMCLLVYKATFDGTPQVVFVSGRVPLDCIRSLCSQFYGGRLKWVVDKYA